MSTCIKEADVIIRENGEQSKFLAEQIQHLNRAIEAFNSYMESSRAANNVSDFYYNNWDDAQNARCYLRRLKERYARAFSRMY